MSDIELDEIRSGYNLSKINSNFNKLEESVNNDLLNLAGGNNTMLQELDMDSNKIINLKDPEENQEAVTLGFLMDVLGDSSIPEESKRIPYVVPRFSGNEVVLEQAVLAADVYVNGRMMFPEYSLDASGKVLTLDFEVTEEDTVVVMLGGLLLPDEELIRQVVSYDTVEKMQQEFGYMPTTMCMTLAYNQEVVSSWTKADSGNGDMSDGTLALDGGGYAKLVIQPVMSVREFGTYADGVNSDTSAFTNALANAQVVMGHSEDTYLLTDQITVPDYKTFDGNRCKINWNGIAGDPTFEGRDWGVFSVFGSFGDTVATKTLTSPIPIFTEKNYPVDDSSVFAGLEGEYLLVFAGSTGSFPELPSFSVMPQFVGITDGTSVGIDYRSGWEIPAGLSITYRRAYPVRGVTIKNFTFEDISPDNEDRNRYASAISLSVAQDCHVSGVTGSKLRNPVVFGQYCTDCTSEYGRVEFPQETGGGQGYHTQWSYSLRCDTHKLTGVEARHICDHTKSAYCNVTDCGDTNTADGAYTNHGAYEHDISYTNCVGWHSIANSGPSFGQSAARIDIRHGNGVALTCGANVLDVTVTNSEFDRVLANSQGFQADGLTVGDVGFSLVSTTTQQGRDTLSKRPNVVKNSSLFFGAGNTLTDFNFTGRVLYLENTELRNVNSSLIGTGAVHMSGGSISGSTAALSLGADSSMKLMNVDTSSFGVRMLDGSDNSYFIIDGGRHTNLITTGIYSNRMQSGTSDFEIRNAKVVGGGGLIIDMPDVAGTNGMFMDIRNNTITDGSITIANRYSGAGKLYYVDNFEQNVTRVTDTTGGRRIIERNITV